MIRDRAAVLARVLMCTGSLVALSAASAPSASAAASGPPEIRTSPANRVPACVTPERLDAFIGTRNTALLPKFAGIGAWYKRHGEAWRVRWDYAFFQMVLETNYLMFRRGDGKPGDVSPRQNNFAGIGATGGGVPGDSYKDVSTGVLAQIQHLVAYSGERVPSPVAPRTQLKQDDIISASLALRRPVTFADLRNRWAADRNYARSIEIVAESFRERFCKGTPAEVAMLPPPPMRVTARPAEPLAEPRAPAPRPAVRPPREAAAPTATPPQACRVLSASYGGRKSVLIRSEARGETHFTVLTVVDGFERSMIDGYVRTHAPGGRQLAEFPSAEAAMARARELCSGTT